MSYFDPYTGRWEQGTAPKQMQPAPVGGTNPVFDAMQDQDTANQGVGMPPPVPAHLQGLNQNNGPISSSGSGYKSVPISSGDYDPYGGKDINGNYNMYVQPGTNNTVDPNYVNPNPTHAGRPPGFIPKLEGGGPQGSWLPGYEPANSTLGTYTGPMTDKIMAGINQYWGDEYQQYVDNGNQRPLNNGGGGGDIPGGGSPGMPPPPIGMPPDTQPMPSNPVGGVESPGGGMTMPEPPPAQGLNAAASMPAPTAMNSATPAGQIGSQNSVGTTSSGGEQHSIDININDQTEETPPMTPSMNNMSTIPQQGGGMMQPAIGGQAREGNLSMPNAGQWNGGGMPAPPQGGQAPYPQPNPSTLPLGPNSPFQGPMPTPPATPPPPLRGGGRGGPGPAQANLGGNWDGMNFGEDNYYGPQQIAGSRPDDADYGSVQSYADDAHQNARRYLDPQQAQQNRRFDQELINKGIDPQSPMGQEQAKLLSMQQGDQNSAAAFDSLGFGQGIQNQMTQQDLARSGLAGDMQKSLWSNQLGASGQTLQKYLGDQNAQIANAGLQNQYNLGMAGIGNQRYGQDLQYQLGASGQDLQRYGMDQNNQLAQGHLDMGRQGQDFNQMLGLDAVDFRNNQFNRQGDQWQDQMYLAAMGYNQPGQVAPINPFGMGGALLDSSGQDGGMWNVAKDFVGMKQGGQ